MERRRRRRCRPAGGRTADRASHGPGVLYADTAFTNETHRLAPLVVHACAVRGYAGFDGRRPTLLAGCMVKMVCDQNTAMRVRSAVVKLLTQRETLSRRQRSQHQRSVGHEPRGAQGQ
jgi:hypothetical protein